MDKHLEKVRWIYDRDKQFSEYIYEPLQYYHHNIFHYDLFDFLRNNNLISKIPISKILDLGCGTGFKSRIFLDLGMKPNNYFGVDLVTTMLIEGKNILQGGHYYTANATELPFQSYTFDIILIFRIFSSIHKKNIRDKICEEAIRVLKHDGIIIYWDVIPPPFYYNRLLHIYSIIARKKNIKNNKMSRANKIKWIKSLNRKEISSSFNNKNKNIVIIWRNIGLRHEIANQLIPKYAFLCDILRRIRISLLNNSILALIKRQ